MPLYDLKCPGCDRQWEVRCKFEELELAVNSRCKVCQQPAEKVMSKPAPPILKGAGFYAVDYGRKTK